MTHNRIVSIVDDDSDIAELFYETFRGSLISLVFGLDVSFRETYGTVDDVAMTNLDSDRGTCTSAADERYGACNIDIGKCDKYYGNYSSSQYSMITQYCMNTTEKIQMSKNLEDVVDSGLIPYWFINNRCTDVLNEENIYKYFLILVYPQ